MITSHKIDLTTIACMDIYEEMKLASVRIHLVQHLLQGVDLGLKLSIWPSITSVQVLSQCIKFVITTKDTVWVEHRYD